MATTALDSQTPAGADRPAYPDASERPGSVARRPACRDAPERPGFLDELLGLAGGAGFFFIAFLAAIPGLLAAVGLLVAPLLLVAVPLLALGAASGALLGAGWGLVRLARLAHPRRRR